MSVARAKWITVYAEGPTTWYGVRQPIARFLGHPPPIPPGELPAGFHPFTGLIVFASTGTEERRALVTSTLEINASNLEWVSHGDDVALLARPLEREVVITAKVLSPLAPESANGVIAVTIRFGNQFVGETTPGGHIPFRCRIEVAGFTPAGSPSLPSHASLIALDDVLMHWRAFRQQSGPRERAAVLGANGSPIGITDDPFRYWLAFEPVVPEVFDDSPLDVNDTPYALQILAGAPAWHAQQDARPAPVLWPFGVSPWGQIETGLDPALPIDFRARERIAFLLRGAAQPSWDFDAYWATSQSAIARTPSRQRPVAAWNRLVAAHRGALEGSRPSAPATMLPELDEVAADGSVVEQRWAVAYVLTPSQRTRFAVGKRALRLRSFRDRPTSFTTMARMRGFRPHDGVGFERTLKIQEPDPRQLKEHREADPDQRDAHYDFELQIEDTTRDAGPPETRRIRIGALDVQIGHPPVPNPPPTFLCAAADWVDGEPRKVVVSFETLLLPVAEVLPGDQDPTELETLAGVDSVSGLVFRPAGASADGGTPSAATSGGGSAPSAGSSAGASTPSAANPAAYILAVAEHASAIKDHQLTLDLRREQSQPVSDEPVTLVVIDEVPLSIAQISIRPGRIRSGVWQSRRLEGAAWSIVDDGSAADLQLPPQVLGEEMLKRYATGEAIPEHERDLYADPSQPFAFKFSQTARFRVARNVLDTTSGEPAWNLRRLFGWAGQRSPGATLEQFDIELLYGLAVSAEPDDLRLVELGAALGVPRDASFPKQRGDEAFLRRHEQLLALTRTRPSLLYIAHKNAPFVRTTIEDGLRYRLRSTREVVHPIDPSRELATTPLMQYFPRRKGGLAGGVDWGFESLNIYDEVRRTPSTRGRLARAAFTAFGGFGSQMAAFANDKSRIYADTELGRTTSYALERVGRIGVLNHPAKHVIEYERTVGAGKYIPDPKGTWSQRPILRKVREYVKLDVQTRQYPDGDEPVASRGFVLAGHFATMEIPVDSRWGSDIPGGWIVPLFRRGDPNIPEPPDVRLQLATAAEPVWGKIGNPEDLVFYTTTDERYGSDTSTWPPVPGVDFPVADMPVIASASDPAPAQDGSQPTPPALHHGYEKFTFRLEGLGARVNMLAGRADAIVEAALDNVTLARRGLVAATGAVDAKLDEASKAVGKLEERVRAEFAAAPANLASKIEAHLDQASRDIKAAADSFKAELVERQRKLLEGWPGDWAAVRDKALARIEQARGMPEAVRELAVTAELNDLARQLFAVPSVLKEIAERARRARAAVDAFRAGLVRFEQEWTARIVRARDEAFGALERKRAVARELFAFFDAACARLRNLGDQMPGIAADAVRQATTAVIAKLRAELPQLDWDKDLQPQIVALVATVRDGAAGIEAAIDAVFDAVPWDPSSVPGLELLDQLAKVTDNPLLQTSVDELRGKLDDAVGKLRTHATNELNSKVNAAIAALGRIDAVEQAKAAARELVALHAQVKTVLAELPELAEQVRANLVSVVAGELADRRAEVARRIEQARSLVLGEARALGDRTMRLVRAFGEAPVASALALSRDRLEYVFHEKVSQLVNGVPKDVQRLASVVGITPSAVLLNRVGIEVPGVPLRTLGVRLPTFSIGERFLPDLRKELRLEQIFPDFAGLRLERLFENVMFPSFAGDGVSIKHGVDPKTRSAWAAADVLVPIDDARVFEISAFTVRLVNARFEAHTRVSAEIGGGVQRTVHGRITGDWRLEIAGQLIAALNRAELSFDGSGKLRFRVTPQAIEVAEALQFLSTLLAYAPNGNGSGLSIAPVFGDGSIPIGVRAAINVALPVMSSGAFSISNLALAAHFELRIGEDGFELGAGLSFATEDRPFNLSVLFLGGGGWLETGVTYAPFANRMSARVSIGLAVGASFPFDIGVARGGVSLLLSIGVVWRTPSGRIEIVLAITFRGELVLLSIVSVGVYLRLEARYISGGSGIHCTGYMSITVKIGWFFKISVKHRVTFKLAGKSGGRRALVETLTAEAAANAYAAAYES